MTVDPTPPKEKTIPELFAETLMGDYDDEHAWNAVWALISKGTPEVFEEAIAFCNSKEPLKRSRGLNILAHFGCFRKDCPDQYLDERVAVALKHLSDESEEVVESAAWALGHIKGESAKNGLLTLRHSTNADIRHAVAFGLAGDTSPEAVDALIELMQDPVSYVRDWATFGLGSELGNALLLDSPKIRDALRGRLTDADEETRNEAVWGLAMRKDPACLQVLLERLEADEWVSGDEGAASYILGITSEAPVAELREGLRRLLTEAKLKNSP